MVVVLATCRVVAEEGSRMHHMETNLCSCCKVAKLIGHIARHLP